MGEREREMPFSPSPLIVIIFYWQLYSLKEIPSTSLSLKIDLTIIKDPYPMSIPLTLTPVKTHQVDC
jgi:hypothetical protein